MTLKRKGSTVSKDDEQVFKRRLRSGRTIETSTSPLRLAKEVVSVSVPSTPRVKPFTSTKSAMKAVRVADNEYELDENHDEIGSSLRPLQTVSVVHSKRALSNETNMDWTSADTGLVGKKGLHGEVLHRKTSISKA